MEVSRNAKCWRRMVNQLAEGHSWNDLHHFKRSLWTLCTVMGKARNKMFSAKKAGREDIYVLCKISSSMDITENKPWGRRWAHSTGLGCYDYGWRFFALSSQTLCAYRHVYHCICLYICTLYEDVYIQKHMSFFNGKLLKPFGKDWRYLWAEQMQKKKKKKFLYLKRVLRICTKDQTLKSNNRWVHFTLYTANDCAYVK